MTGIRRTRIRRAGAAAAFAVSMFMAPPVAAEGAEDVLKTIERVVRELFKSDDAKAPERKAPQVKKPAEPPPDIYPEIPKVGFDAKVRDIQVDEAAGRIPLTVVRSQAAGEVVRIKWSTQSASAVAGQDFAAATGVIEMAPTQMKAVIQIEIIDDRQHERAENFRVILGETRNAQVDRTASSAIINIRDNDPPPKPPAKPAKLRLSQASLEFGQLQVGPTGRRRLELFVDNVGGKPGKVLFGMRVDATAFAIVDNGCGAQGLSPRQRCRVAIEFKPVAEGRFTGRVDVKLDGKLIGNVDLAGRGTLPPVVDDPARARIAALKEQRRSGSGRYKSTRIPDDPPAEKPQYSTKDPDYVESIGVGKTFFSLPVTRDRVIDVHRYIPCVLGDDINSQIPGFVHCQVESNVYGDDGRLVLIAGGTKVFGTYESLAEVGDTRLNIIWKRMTKPDGASVVIDTGFQSVDATGRTGIPGEVDTRLWERYGNAVLLTVIAGGAGLLVPEDNDSFSAAYETLAENLGEITTQMIEENIDLRPVMTVKAGTRLNILTLTDLWIPEADRIVALPAGSTAPAAVTQTPVRAGQAQRPPGG